MAHVGVERLGTRDREKHAAQDDEADPAVRIGTNRIAWTGLNATSTPRSSLRCVIRPSPAMTRNQTAVIGPNSAATLPVPWRWAANSASRMAMVIGMT